MDYYTYQNGVHVKSHARQEYAEKWACNQAQAWIAGGAVGHPEYKVQYNPTGQTVFTLARDHYANQMPLRR